MWPNCNQKEKLSGDNCAASIPTLTNSNLSYSKALITDKNADNFDISDKISLNDNKNNNSKAGRTSSNFDKEDDSAIKKSSARKTSVDTFDKATIPNQVRHVC